MNATTCAFESPLGAAPELTSDQITAGNSYIWLEHVYAGDNTKGWVLV